MPINTYIAGPIDANNYLVYDNASRDAVLIDCSDYMPDLILFTEQKRINVKYILLTHGHFDHILGIPEMQKKENIPVLINEKDLFLTQHLSEMLCHFRINSDVTSVRIDKFIDEQTPLKVGNYSITTLSTPGHTPGGQSYYVDGKLFSGDSLFKHSIGRTDLEGGNHSQLINSVKTKLFTLPPKTVVYPGHVDFTTIEDEIKNNIFVR